MGIDPNKLGGRRKPPATPADRIPIWPDMLDGYALFMAMGTQWRWAGAGLAGAFQTGLDLGVVETVARSSGIRMTDDGRIPPPVFADLRTLEGEALRYWSARRG